MKNKKQLFSLLLLASCSLVQQTVFAAAAAGGLHKESVYNTKRNAGFNSAGKQLVGIKFAELINALKIIGQHWQADLYKVLLGSVAKSIYDEKTPDNLKLLKEEGEEGRKLLTSMQQELKRLQETQEILPFIDPRDADDNYTEFKEKEKNDVLWPVYVWAIEQDNYGLTDELWQILGDKQNPNGEKKLTAEELATSLNSTNALKAILDRRAQLDRHSAF